MTNFSKKVKSLIGNTYGYLTVKEFSHTDKKISFWKCLCVCGNHKIVRSNNLKQSKTISCGCKRSENISKNLNKSDKEASFNEIYRQYKYRTEAKNLQFQLSKLDFFKITQKNCHYCDTEPNTKSKTHDKRYNGTYVYNGIDRVDNSKGYLLNNIVSCCEICNRMKLALSVDNFMSHIEKIYKKAKNNEKTI